MGEVLLPQGGDQVVLQGGQVVRVGETLDEASISGAWIPWPRDSHRTPSRDMTNARLSRCDSWE
jgi:hypothetical protein